MVTAGGMKPNFSGAGRAGERDFGALWRPNDDLKNISLLEEGK